MPPKTDFTCPACGGDVHPNSKSCPHCGTRPERWAAGGEIIDGAPNLGIPDDDFDYDEFVTREFGADGKLRDGGPHVSPPIRRIWIITALILVGTILILILNGLW